MHDAVAPTLPTDFTFMGSFHSWISRNVLISVAASAAILNSVPSGSGLRRMHEMRGRPPVFVVWGHHADMLSSRIKIKPLATNF